RPASWIASATPGGNFTGINFMASELGAKRIGVLHEMVHHATRIALLVHPNNPAPADSMIQDVQSAASRSEPPIDFFKAGNNHELETDFTALGQNGAEALVVGADPLFIDRRVQLVTLATRHLLPTVYFLRAFAEVGGLVSYGASDFARYREVGIHTG